MSTVSNAIGGAFSPLRLPNFRLYIGAQLISNVGTFLQQTAQAWVVWELTRSEAALGTVTMLNSLPILLFTPWAGVLADRLDRRRLLIGTQAAMMTLAFILSFLIASGMVQIWHVYVLATLLGICTMLDFPTHQAFLGDLAGMSEVRKAINMNGMVLQGSRMIGPALAAWIIAQAGTATAFAVNGITFIAVIISLLLIRAQQTRSDRTHAAPLRQMGDALRFMRAQPRLQDMFALSALITFCAWAVILNLMPSVADTVLGGRAETLGALTAASGAGALLALLVVVPLAQTLQRGGVVLAAAMLWTGAALFVFGISTWLPLSMIAIGAATMGSPIVFTMALGSTQILAPPDMRARLISLFTMVSLGIQPFAAIVVGNIAQAFGVQIAIVMNAAICIALTLALIVLRRGFWGWQVATIPSVIPVPAPVGTD
jgi:MFS family permease